MATRKRVRIGDQSAMTRGAQQDTLTNVVTGMGTDRDKLTGTLFNHFDLPREQLDAAYRSDWISRKGVDIPAYDATREWRSWEADKLDITLLEDAEKGLGLQRKIMLGLQRGRLYGGGAVIMGVDQGNSDEELIVDQVKKDSLKFLHVVSKYELSSGPINWDVMSPYFGQPSYYDRSSPGAASVRIHPSRVVRFVGQEIPDIQVANGWGDSVLQSVADAVRSTGMVSSSIAQLVAEAKIDVVRIPGLSTNMGDQKYEDRLKKRFGTANTIKSVYSMLIVDKEEEWDRIATAFTGMPEVVQMYLLLTCGALDIPATRFLGQSPSGLSATGESDTRNYYDRVSTEQEVMVSPTMSPLDEVLVRSALGAKPDGLFYQWNPLWQLDEVQKATVAVQKANVMTADVNAGIITPLVMQKARENQLIEDGTYPGIEAIIAEFGEDYVEPEPAPVIVQQTSTDPNAPPTVPGTDPAVGKAANENAPAEEGVAPQGRAGARGRTTTGDMSSRIRAGSALPRQRVRIPDASTPRSLYVRRDVLNVKDIKKWAKAAGFNTSLDDMHVTIVYSKTPVDWLKAGDTWTGGEDDTGNLTIKPGGPRVMEKFGKAIVLAFASTDLGYRHMSIMERCEGASWEHDDYTPHITITYDGGALDILNMVPYQGAIELGPEIFEEIDPTFNNETDVVES